MLKFPTKTLNTIKDALLRQKKEVEGSLKEIKADDPATDNSLPESSEPGTDSYIAETHGKSLVFENRLKTTSDSIKKALVKIAKRTYGKCESCGKQIEIKRLLAMPTAQYCLSCSKKNQSSKI